MNWPVLDHDDCMVIGPAPRKVCAPRLVVVRAHLPAAAVPAGRRDLTIAITSAGADRFIVDRLLPRLTFAAGLETTNRERPHLPSGGPAGRCRQEVT